jgi:hypothetical protein
MSISKIRIRVPGDRTPSQRIRTFATAAGLGAFRINSWICGRCGVFRGFCPSTFQGAATAFETEGHISVVTAAMFYKKHVSQDLQTDRSSALGGGGRGPYRQRRDLKCHGGRGDSRPRGSHEQTPAPFRGEGADDLSRAGRSSW